MKPRTAIALALFFSLPLSAESLQVSCGSSSGYSYYFLGGLIGEDSEGFTEDGIKEGQYTLIMDDSGSGDVLSKDATGTIKSAISQGAEIAVIRAGDQGLNWLVVYPDGTLEIYSLNYVALKATSYRNTTGNTSIAKNSLFISDCKPV